MIISDTDYTNIAYKAIIDTFNSKNWGDIHQNNIRNR